MTITGSEDLDRTNVAPMSGRMPLHLAPMLPSSAAQPFDSPDHIFELMWGGVRAQARVADGSVHLVGQNGIDLLPAFTELARIPALLHAHEALLDGEIVALDADGQPSFDLLRPRLHSLLEPHAGDVPAALKRRPPGQVVYQAFDLLWLDGRSLIDRPLWQRKNRLHEIISPAAEFTAVDFVNDEGVAFFDAVLQRKLDGIIAKEKAGTYTPGTRSKSWTEVRALESGDFAIGGYTFGGARRKGEPFSQLLLGAYEQGRFEYVGAVSGGLTDAEARSLIDRLEPLVTEHAAFSDAPRIPRLIYWTQPRLVCRVRFSEWTRDGYLRFPIFNALRPDLRPEDCVLT
jgi:DNA ligase D-like protein (predicted ligase)